MIVKRDFFFSPAFYARSFLTRFTPNDRRVFFFSIAPFKFTPRDMPRLLQQKQYFNTYMYERVCMSNKLWDFIRQKLIRNLQRYSPYKPHTIWNSIFPNDISHVPLKDNISQKYTFGCYRHNIILFCGQPNACRFSWH